MPCSFLRRRAICNYHCNCNGFSIKTNWQTCSAVLHEGCCILFSSCFLDLYSSLEQQDQYLECNRWILEGLDSCGHYYLWILSYSDYRTSLTDSHSFYHILPHNFSLHMYTGYILMYIAYVALVIVGQIVKKLLELNSSKKNNCTGLYFYCKSICKIAENFLASFIVFCTCSFQLLYTLSRVGVFAKKTWCGLFRDSFFNSHSCDIICHREWRPSTSPSGYLQWSRMWRCDAWSTTDQHTQISSWKLSKSFRIR